VKDSSPKNSSNGDPEDGILNNKILLLFFKKIEIENFLIA